MFSGIELAPRDREALVNPDRWWSERRKVAGELLDLDEPRLANFFTGWIALRFLNDARAAALRFERAAEPDGELDRVSRVLYTGVALIVRRRRRRPYAVLDLSGLSAAGAARSDPAQGVNRAIGAMLSVALGQIAHLAGPFPTRHQVLVQLHELDR